MLKCGNLPTKESQQGETLVFHIYFERNVSRIWSFYLWLQKDLTENFPFFRIFRRGDIFLGWDNRKISPKAQKRGLFINLPIFKILQKRNIPQDVTTIHDRDQGGPNQNRPHRSPKIHESSWPHENSWLHELGSSGHMRNHVVMSLEAHGQQKRSWPHEW